MSGLRITDIDAVQIYAYLVTCTAAHTDVGLGAHIATLSHVNAGHVFQQVIDTFDRQRRYRGTVHESYYSRTLSQCYGDTAARNGNCVKP